MDYAGNEHLISLCLCSDDHIYFRIHQFSGSICYPCKSTFVSPPKKFLGVAHLLEVLLLKHVEHMTKLSLCNILRLVTSVFLFFWEWGHYTAK